MDAEIKGYLTEFGLVKKEIDASLRGLPDEAANWKPLPKDTNSIYVIMTHLVGTQDYWVRQIINREAVKRDRDAEFRSSGKLSDLVARWEKACVQTEAIWGNLTQANLAEVREIANRPQWGVITVRWCVNHVISHCAIHLGHIQLTKQAWEQRKV